MTHDIPPYTTRGRPEDGWPWPWPKRGALQPAFACWDQILSIEDCQVCQGRCLEYVGCSNRKNWIVATFILWLGESKHAVFSSGNLTLIAVEDFPVANDLQYLFKVRTKMRRDWRPQAIWHLRKIAHEQHPENLILMLGDHCKYPSYDYVQLDKNMPDLPTLCSEFPPESAHFFTFAVIRQSIQKYPEKVWTSHIKKSTSLSLSVMTWTRSDVDAYSTRAYPRHPWIKGAPELHGSYPPASLAWTPRSRIHPNPSFLAKQLTQTGTIHPELPDRYPCNH